MESPSRILDSLRINAVLRIDLSTNCSRMSDFAKSTLPNILLDFLIYNRILSLRLQGKVGRKMRGKSIQAKLNPFVIRAIVEPLERRLLLSGLTGAGTTLQAVAGQSID